MGPLKFGLGLAGLALSAGQAIFSPKKKADTAAPLPTATRDDARSQIAATDALRKRRGGAADILSGTRGAEAAPSATGKVTLGS